MSKSTPERPDAPEDSQESPSDANAMPPSLSTTEQDGGTNAARLPIVGLGASAGGLEALKSFFEAVPEKSGMAYVVVVHLDPQRVSLLPELLQKATSMPVLEAKHQCEVLSDHVYVVPPNRRLTIANGRLHLRKATRTPGGRLTIDDFLCSLAREREDRAVAVILSGSGSDGSLGVRAVKAAGGIVLAQTADTAGSPGMPESTRRTGVADIILAPADMPAAIARLLRCDGDGEPSERTSPEFLDHTAFRDILETVRARTGQDFSLYKANTLLRRIRRRMVIHRLDTLQEYARHLAERSDEVDTLYGQFLIGVTRFFRDGDAFAALEKAIGARLLPAKKADDTVRIWVPGCSTGEEAYGLAIVLHELTTGVERRRIQVQVFATDLDAEAIEIARRGCYPSGIAAEIASERLERYFDMDDDGSFRIKKIIREMIVFAPQNLCSDPPFTKLDLISCRNLLIYFDPALQARILPMFHYALRDDGILFLGSSETIGKATDLFAPLDKRWKIFSRKSSEATPPRFTQAPAPMPEPVTAEPTMATAQRRADTLALAEALLRESKLPPSVVVDADGEVLYVLGKVGDFLEPPEGAPSLNVISMARVGLRSALRESLLHAANGESALVRQIVEIDEKGASVGIRLSIRPLLEHLHGRSLALVSFERLATEHAPAPSVDEPQGERTVAQLEAELRQVREGLLSTIEELETSNEELKSSNEELQSTNEELQSTNEELETSKEELQSLNEESATVSAELQSRVDELAKANDDLKNLLDSTEIATIFLDQDLCIRRFTSRAVDILPLQTADLGRPVAHLVSRLGEADLAALAEATLDDLAVREIEASSCDGTVYRLRVRPYRTVNNVIDGVVMTFENVTERRRIEDECRAGWEHFHLLFELAPTATFLVAESGTIIEANARAADWTGRSIEGLVGSSFADSAAFALGAKPLFEDFKELPIGRARSFDDLGNHRDEVRRSALKLTVVPILSRNERLYLLTIDESG